MDESKVRSPRIRSYARFRVESLDRSVVRRIVRTALPADDLPTCSNRAEYELLVNQTAQARRWNIAYLLNSKQIDGKN